jgi:hypothetical protein
MKRKPAKRILDTEKVWKKLASDADFRQGLPLSARKVFREVIDAMPRVLRQRLSSKVTLSNLGKARLDVLEHMLGSDFMKNLAVELAKIVPEAAAVTLEELTDGMKAAFAQGRLPLMEMIHNTAEFLEINGLTEREAFSQARGGLNAANMRAYDAGTLTIADLLESQPVLVVTCGEIQSMPDEPEEPPDPEPSE